MFGAALGVVSFHYGLRGPFFTLVTIAFAEIVRLVLLHWEFVGAANGILLTDFYRLWRSDGEAWADAMPEIGNAAQDAYMRQLDELVKLLDGAPHVLPDFRAALSVQERIEAILAGAQV